MDWVWWSLGGIYWLGTIRILINLKADSIFMYLPFSAVLEYFLPQIV